MSLNQFFGNLKTGAELHSPEILTGIGIGGWIVTTVLAISATPKAMKQIEKDKPKGFWAKIKSGGKYYILPLITGAASSACIVKAQTINSGRVATLAAAYAVSETALKDRIEKTVETVGEKKEREIRDKIAEEKVKKDPVESKQVIVTGKGKTLCYDVVSKRYFESDIDKIRRAENLLNQRLLREMYISLNDFYDEIGLEKLDPCVGDELGWNANIHGFIEIDYSSQLATDGTPCLVISFNVGPRCDYRNLH